MPSFRRVSFSDRNHYSRLPHEDELYVMKAFARHADNCDSCYDPYQVYRDGATLCPRGHQRALDVAQYVYNKGGQAYSQVDKERNQRVLIEIPANCEAVRLLLKAMDRGLRVMRKHTPTSYDRSYYVPARLSVPDNYRSTPATRPSSSTSINRPTTITPTTKQPIHIAPQAQPQSQSRSSSRSRSRAVSTSSTSSTNSSSSRTSRPCFVRSRSKDGKRGSSPVYIRPGISRLNSSTGKSTSSTKDASSTSHVRNNSASSSSSGSRSSSIFSRSGSRSNSRRRSRNDSLSSESSLDDAPEALKTSKSKFASASAASASASSTRAPPAKLNFTTPVYETIAPRDRSQQRPEREDVSPLVSPIRLVRSSSRR